MKMVEVARHGKKGFGIKPQDTKLAGQCVAAAQRANMFLNGLVAKKYSIKNIKKNVSRRILMDMYHLRLYLVLHGQVLDHMHELKHHFTEQEIKEMKHWHASLPNDPVLSDKLHGMVVNYLLLVSADMNVQKAKRDANKVLMIVEKIVHKKWHDAGIFSAEKERAL